MLLQEDKAVTSKASLFECDRFRSVAPQPLVWATEQGPYYQNRI